MGIDGIGILPGYSQSCDICLCYRCHVCNMSLVIYRDLVKAGRSGRKTGMGIDGIGILPGYSQSCDIRFCHRCYIRDVSLIIYRNLIKTG